MSELSIPPQNLEAEESVLGAMMLAPAAIVAVREILDADDFYRESHGRIYTAALALADRDEPVDAITLASELEQRGKLEEIGGRVRLHELARIVPATSNVRHYAEIVKTAAARRREDSVGAALRAAAQDGGLEAHPELAEDLRAVLAHEPPARREAVEPFSALDLASFLAQPPEPPDWDLEGWFARGDLVLAFGDPGVGKSMWTLAFAIKARAGGNAEHLGDAVATRRVLVVDLESPEDVVYSRARGFGLRGAVDGFAYLHRPPGFDLLDADGLVRLRATIVEHSAELVVIDSLRRAAPGLDENDSRQVSLLLSALRALASELLATILVVHHPRKPVGEARVEALYAARGSGDLVGSADSAIFFRKLSGGLVRIEHAKARRGREHEHVHFRVVADEETGAPVLERIEPEQATHDDLDGDVLAYVIEHPGQATKVIAESLGKSPNTVRPALKRLEDPGRLDGVLRKTSRDLGTPGTGHYWYPRNHAASETSETDETPRDASASRTPRDDEASQPSAPRRGDASPDVSLETDPLEAPADQLPAHEAAIVHDLGEFLAARLAPVDRSYVANAGAS